MNWSRHPQVWIALVVLTGGCSSKEEIGQLTAILGDVDKVLIAKQAVAHRRDDLAKRRTALDALVAQRAKVDLGPDPRAALQKAMPAASTVTQTGGAYELAGTAKAGAMLGQLNALSRSQPGLILGHLGFTATGFDARLMLPPTLPGPNAMPPSAAWQPPPLPPAATFERGEAEHLRQQIALDEASIAQLGRVESEVVDLEQAIRRDSGLLGMAAMGDRLAYALESSAIFFAGAPPWFATGVLDFHGNDVVLTAPDPGPGPDPQRETEALHQRFAEPRVERNGGQVTMRLSHLPIPVPDVDPLPRTAKSGPHLVFSPAPAKR